MLVKKNGKCRSWTSDLLECLLLNIPMLLPHYPVALPVYHCLSKEWLSYGAGWEGRFGSKKALEMGG